ncbi:MAG TPA: DUF4129 domain-containing protein [Pyrinomonadaceae bacterium]|nr:DUF4129 domain-containing protein [Pyrinomonadaceae bacterium]
MAAEVVDYQKRVHAARAEIQDLLANVAAEEEGEEPNPPNAEVFAGVRKNLPASEKLVTPNGEIETNNQWLIDRLKAAEEQTDLTKRAEILNEIDERLAGISAELDKLQAAQAADRSKDEDKRKLSEILSRPEYQKPEVKPPEESLMSRLLRQFFEWLESILPKFGMGTAPDLSGAVSVTQYILIGLILLLLGFLAYKLVPLFVPRFRRKAKGEKEDRVILGETIADDVSASDLFGDAERLAREGDLRGAIRKGYVALLCEMSDRKLIGLARHKTNRDYLRDVRSRREIYNEMNGLTGSFERHWYGSQDARREDWEEFRRRCGDTIKAI